jgi:hypothetical protein
MLISQILDIEFLWGILQKFFKGNSPAGTGELKKVKSLLDRANVYILHYLFFLFSTLVITSLKIENCSTEG